MSITVPQASSNNNNNKRNHIVPLTLNAFPQSGHLYSDPQSGPLGLPGPRLSGNVDTGNEKQHVFVYSCT